MSEARGADAELLAQYEAAVGYLDSLLKWHTTRPAGYDRQVHLSRERMLLRRWGDPHTHYRIAHITGTSGKGSTSAMLASILRAAGHHTGCTPRPTCRRTPRRSASMRTIFHSRTRRARGRVARPCDGDGGGWRAWPALVFRGDGRHRADRLRAAPDGRGGCRGRYRRAARFHERRHGRTSQSSQMSASTIPVSSATRCMTSPSRRRGSSSRAFPPSPRPPRPRRSP